MADDDAVTVQGDPPTTGHAERRGEPGEGYWAGQYRMEDGSWSGDEGDADFVGVGQANEGGDLFLDEFVELPEDADQEAER